LIAPVFASYWINQIDSWVSKQSKLVPAFYPTIEKSDSDFSVLASNYAFMFKNEPGHFHNGGCWPVIQGFLIQGLRSYGANNVADALQARLANSLLATIDSYPFPEYFQGESQQPGGKQMLSFSAAGWLLAASKN
jgi:glycogen debranching enzyme